MTLTQRLDPERLALEHDAIYGIAHTEGIRYLREYLEYQVENSGGAGIPEPGTVENWSEVAAFQLGKAAAFRDVALWLKTRTRENQLPDGA